MEKSKNHQEQCEIDKYLVEYREYELPSIDELQLQLEIDGKVEIIGKPAGYRILKNGYIELNIAGIIVRTPIIRLGLTPQSIIALLRTINKWVIRKSGNNVVLAKVEKIYGNDDIEPLLNCKPLEVLIRGMGYRLDDKILRIMIPRLLPLVENMHVVQLTNYETGKTYFSLYLHRYLGWGYVTSPPTTAGLFYDASKGAYGLAVVSNGIVFDEIDKWKPEYMRNNDVMIYMPTFLEQGIVVRPVSRRHSIPIERKIPTIWFGNNPYSGGESERRRVEQIFISWGVDSIGDRIALAHIEEEKIRILDYVTYRILPPGMMIRYIEYLRSIDVSDRAKHDNIGFLSGRYKRHAIKLVRALHKLGFDYTKLKVDLCVTNGWSECLDDYLFG